MIRYMIIAAWIIFAAVILVQVWPAIKSWANGGEREYADISQLGQHRHSQTEGRVSVYDVLERCTVI